jgi:hypothetical protein
MLPIMRSDIRIMDLNLLNALDALLDVVARSLHGRPAEALP